MVFTMEEHMTTGGFGESITRVGLNQGYTVPAYCFGVRDEYIQHGNHEILMKEAGLDARTMAETIRRILKGEQIL